MNIEITNIEPSQARLITTLIFNSIILAGIFLLGEYRKKINFKYIWTLTAVYVYVLILDIGISTPYGLNKCRAQETHVVLSYLIQKIGVFAYPTQIIYQLVTFFFFLIIFESVVTKMKGDLYQGFMRRIYTPIWLALFAIHIWASFHNFYLC